MDLIDTALLDALRDAAKTNPRLRTNRNFHETLDAPAQRLPNALEPGTRVPAHRHAATAETYVVLRGKLRIDFYDDFGRITESAELDPAHGNFGVQIPAGTWHGITSLESGTVIFEVKDGPYAPLSEGNILRIPAEASRS